MENKKVDTFTIERKKDWIKNKPNHLKQTLMMLGLLVMVIAIPLLIFSLIQPEGSFETRREASESTTFYGYLRKTEELTNKELPLVFISDNYYYFADKNGYPIDFGETEGLTSYIIVAKANIEDLIKEGEIYSINQEQIYSISNVKITNSIAEYSNIGLLITTDDSQIEETEDDTLIITSISPIPQNIKAEETFSFKYKFEEDNVSAGDLINRISIKGEYIDGNKISDDNWSITTTPSQDEILNATSPLTVTVSGTPSKSAIGKTINLEISGSDLVGNTTSITNKLQIIENTSPEINKVLYYENNQKKENYDYELIYEEKVNIKASIIISAFDKEDGILNYSFSQIPSTLENTKIENNKITFDINWKNFKDEINSYQFYVIVGDGTKSTKQLINLNILKKYLTKNIPLCVLDSTTCQDWSAHFAYTQVKNTYQVEFERYDNIYPNNDEISDFRWIFGDGTETSGKSKLTHTYPLSGNYEATLVITNERGESTSKTQTVTVLKSDEKQPPLASFIVNPIIGTAPLTIQVNPKDSFDSDGEIVKYLWDFGDGQIQEHNSPITFEHTYNESGTYTITLEVTDNEGRTSSESSLITVGTNETPIVMITKPNKGTYSGSNENPLNKIYWLVKDNENNSPLMYQLYIIESESGGFCNEDSTINKETYLLTSGDILYSSGSYLPSNFNWDTEKTKSGIIDDGYYCLKINIIDDTYQQLAFDYSDEPIEILNSQHSPYFITQTLPDAVLNQNYESTIVAKDEDNEEITFELVKGPSWIKLSSEGKLSGTPTKSGPEIIIITITDGYTKLNKIYNINTKETPEQILPTVVLGTNIEVFYEDSGIIEWDIENSENISSIKLQYSIDGENWIDLTKPLPVDTTEYNWDVSDLEEGTYQIRIIYYGINNEILGASEIKEIEITNIEIQKETKSSIFNLTPKEDEQILDQTPQISAYFKAMEERSINLDSIKVNLDNIALHEKEDFEAFKNGFAYTIKTPLSIGLHTVKVSFKDDLGEITEKEWAFEIVEKEIVGSETKEGENNIYVAGIITILLISTITISAYFLVKYINDSKGRKYRFVKKTKQKERKTIDEEKRRKIDEDAKNFFSHKNTDLDKLKDSEIVKKEQGEKNIDKGY